MKKIAMHLPLVNANPYHLVNATNLLSFAVQNRAFP